VGSVSPSGLSLKKRVREPEDFPRPRAMKIFRSSRSPDSRSPYSRAFPSMRTVTAGGFVPITVAGPLRIRTGFPFTETQTYSIATIIPQPGRKAPGFLTACGQ
jgi:hypothetical protein